jgi:hypothetical protein
MTTPMDFSDYLNRSVTTILSGEILCVHDEIDD